MDYRLNTFMDETQATKYPHSISILYCIKGMLIIGETYRNTIPVGKLMGNIKRSKWLLDNGMGDIEAIIKVNH